MSEIVEYETQPVDYRFKLHEGTPKCPGGQVRMVALSLQYRVMVAAVGRRFGKTQAAKFCIYEHYRRCKGRTFKAAYCGPTYARVKPEYDEFKQLFKGMIEKHSDTELWVKFKPCMSTHGHVIEGGTVHFWSLKEHDNLRGAKLDFYVIDECSEVAEEAYTATLTPMTADTKGHALLIGTPRRVGIGFTWFRREFARGNDTVLHGSGLYACMSGPSEGNPFLDPAELEELRSRSPDPLTRREEYDAEFLSDVGAVFARIDEVCCLPYTRNGEECISKTLYEDIGHGPVIDPARRFLIGYDIGFHEDPAVIVAFDRKTKEQVYLWRGHGISFYQQFTHIKRVKAMLNDAMIVADINGLGEVPGQQMGREFKEGFKGKKWSNKTKEEDVTRGMILFQEVKWKLLNVPWQKSQYFEFTRKKLPSGVWRYEHPIGGHDDAVCAGILCTEILITDPHEDRKPKEVLRPFDENGMWNIDWFTQRSEARLRGAKRRGLYR